MEIAKLTSKGQITIPKSVRDDLGVDTGDKLVFIKTEGGYLVCCGDKLQFDLPAEEVVRAPERRAAVPVAFDNDEEEEREEREERSEKSEKSEKDKGDKKKKKTNKKQDQD